MQDQNTFLTKPGISKEQTLFSLLKALSTGRVVGFLGSGLSLPYGHVTWGELREHVTHEALIEIRRARASQPNITKAEKLKTLEEFLNQSKGSTISTEQTLVIFEVLKTTFETCDPDKGAYKFKEAISDITNCDAFAAQNKAKTRLYTLFTGLMPKSAYYNGKRKIIEKDLYSWQRADNIFRKTHIDCEKLYNSDFSRSLLNRPTQHY
jgi:hypothetical protein